jgi:hypothetical protein
MAANAASATQSKTYDSVTTHGDPRFLELPPARSEWWSMVSRTSNVVVGEGENERAAMRGRMESSGIGKPPWRRRRKEEEKVGEVRNRRPRTQCFANAGPGLEGEGWHALTGAGASRPIPHKSLDCRHRQTDDVAGPKSDG